ncbi:hypothetical protein DSO57_1022122 [Entomophthora muscae]|uniref:Uncharacterized protein n=1 Tax=Entomophthora muscae TaxID=34485 RepID=A0ACC2SS54_9FUNG|nr:hypothetical protein DSO57_1022122 [Entomophthora muscae]
MTFSSQEHKGASGGSYKPSMFNAQLPEDPCKTPQLTRDSIVRDGQDIPTSPTFSILETPDDSSCTFEEFYADELTDDEYDYSTPPLQLHERTREQRAFIESTLALRPHMLSKQQVESISRVIIEMEHYTSFMVQTFLKTLVVNSSQVEYSILIHTLAAAAAFHDARTSPGSHPPNAIPCPPDAVDHYSCATELLPLIETPHFLFYIVYKLLDVVRQMALCFL